MNVEKRDEHLNKLIGVKTEEKEVVDLQTPLVPSQGSQITTSNGNVVAIPDPSNKNNELIKARIRMDSLSQKLDDVINSHTDVAVEFGKARDVEAVATLAKTLVEINKEIRETNKELYSKESESDDEKDAKVVNKTQNNFVFNGDMRTLNDIISGKSKNEDF